MTLKKIEKLSAKIGKDLTLIQGGGGNTSLKEGGKMWVKASGKWLINAEKENIFVSVDDASIRKAIKRGDIDPVSNFVNDGQTLRPSIETTLHALLPHKIVLHTHSLNTLAWAVRKDGKKQLENKLKDINWAWIDYQKPGITLTNAIVEVMDTNPDVLILANHGLVVGADSCKEAEQLLNTIELRLSPKKLNISPESDLDKLKEISKNTHYKPASIEAIHAISTNAQKLEIASQGIFYPDHVVFLGAELCVVSDNIEATIKKYYAKYGVNPVALYIKKIGVLVEKDITSASEVMLLALSYMLMRLDLSVQCNYLTQEDVSQLLDWEAEKYRQKIK